MKFNHIISQEFEKKIETILTCLRNEGYKILRDDIIGHYLIINIPTIIYFFKVLIFIVSKSSL